MKRPYLNYSIQELEVKFSSIRKDRATLEILLHELTFRTTTKAKNLTAQVKQGIGELSKTTSPLSSVKSTSATKVPVDFPLTDEVRKDGVDAAQILRAWTALEVLSPQAFLRPEQLAQNMDKSLIKPVGGTPLPWFDEGQKAKPDHRLFYHIVLGTIKMPDAVGALMATFPDSRAERPAKLGEAVLASLLVNRDGTLIEEGAAAISSFGWGVSKVLKGELDQLAEWADLEPQLSRDFYAFIKRVDQEGNLLPITIDLINQAYRWIVSKISLPESVLRQAPFTIRVNHYISYAGPPDPLLVNSFYLKDLTTARKALSDGKATANLKRYLGGLVPKHSYDLLSDNQALEQVIAPQNIPAARWPGQGRHPLVLLQQAAVNLSVNSLKNTGIIPVNGPPGTGKTTLLRDVVAGLVTDRARVMVTFDDPKKAFKHVGEKINVGNCWLHLYQLDERLKGFEILVASSNNKAVENVSAELPSLAAIADDATDLRYFKTLSDAVYQKETWGMCAAVLGNALNRGLFMQRFWWDKETGFRTYLAAASGNSQDWEERDLRTGMVRMRTPLIISQENAPAGPEQALVAWQKARLDFQIALERVEVKTADLAVIRLNVQKLPALIAQETKLHLIFKSAVRLRDQAELSLTNAGDLVSATNLIKQRRETQTAVHRQTRPGLFARIFRTAGYKQWQTANQKLLADLSETLEELERQIKLEQDAKHILAKQRQETLKAEDVHKATLKALRDIEEIVAKFRSKSGSNLIDADFWLNSHEAKQLASPWFNEAEQRLRDTLFSAAMKVHKAFIDASAQYFKHNLSVLMMTLSGKNLSDDKKRALLPDMWSSLFLVVPCISTTFASVGRMMGDLPAESLGYLIVDEAGQALPQAAVGAIMRTRKAIVVGDPVQIEPVVSLPDSLTRSICGQFLIEADRYNAPEASVQTLSDMTSAYRAEFTSTGGSRSVGVPLLVHRRCAAPMFTISNEIGYGGQMVHAKSASISPIRNLLGPSSWFDVSGPGQDKWCSKEGEWVLGMLQKLKKAGIKPDIYIVSPFVIVADNLRLMLRNSGILYNWAENPEIWPLERVGTVHTVQGREAEAIIFVLGAPLPTQTGARNWAGLKPNLLNVAVTRAKEVVYVIGNRGLWKSANLFKELHQSLDASSWEG